MPSPNLAITHVAASQNQKEVTINDAVDALDNVITASFDVDVSAGGTIALSETEFRRHAAVVLTGSPAVAVTLQLPAVRKFLFVQNSTSQSATVTSTTGGATVVVGAGQKLLLYATGSAVLPIEAALGASGVTPGSYGDGGNVPRLTVDAQGRITGITTLPVTGGGGGSSGGGFVAGATGNLGSGSTSAYATKGLLFVPDQAILVSHLRAYIDATSIGQDHYAQIAEVSGATAADTITTVLGTSATLPSTSTELLLYRFPFATAVLLDAGKTYLLASVNASGTATTANRVAVIAPGGSLGWDLNAPGETSWGTPQLDSIGVGVGQAPAAFGTGKFLIAIEGAIV
jgi:hypothetical protein